MAATFRWILCFAALAAWSGAARGAAVSAAQAAADAGRHWARWLREPPGPVNLDVSGRARLGKRSYEVRCRIRSDGSGRLAAAWRFGSTRVRVRMDARATRLVVVDKKVVFEGRGAPERPGTDPLREMLICFREGMPPAAAAFFQSPESAAGALGMLAAGYFDAVGVEQVNGRSCIHLRAKPTAELGRLDLWLDGGRPARAEWTSKDGRSRATLRVRRASGELEPLRTDAFKTVAVARSELDRTLIRGVARALNILLEHRVPAGVPLMPAQAEGGRLECVNGKWVALLRGSHRQMGRQHGLLLKRQVRELFDTVVYAMGAYVSVERGVWFPDELREARRRTWPYTPVRFKEEMAGLAEGAGLPQDLVEMGTMFPEYFHCSGFAVWGKATKGGALYHGRVLDYMTDIGLQQRAVVFVCKPDRGRAFANVGYAGFIGCVTGMNARQIAVGEMGGRGEGHWDGCSMGLLVRRVLEEADTLDEAVDIFRRARRTCEYYYVVSDGKIPSARGLATSWRKFEVIRPNQAHPLLPHPIPDAVLLSSDRRYEALVANVKKNYGRIDAAGARALIDDRVAMRSNLHDVVFAPQTLDMWVADASPTRQAFRMPYARLNLAALLQRMK